MNQESKTEHYQDMVPEEGVPVCGVRLLSYLDEEGKMRHKIHHFGEGSAAYLIALLETAKMELLIANHQAE